MHTQPLCVHSHTTLSELASVLIDLSPHSYDNVWKQLKSQHALHFCNRWKEERMYCTSEHKISEKTVMWQVVFFLKCENLSNFIYFFSKSPLGFWNWSILISFTVPCNIWLSQDYVYHITLGYCYSCNGHWGKSPSPCSVPPFHSTFVTFNRKANKRPSHCLFLS